MANSRLASWMGMVFSRDLPKHLKRRFGSRKAAFEAIYELRHWGDAESVSGWGSTVEVTRHIREALPGLIARHGITSMLDVPCGDFHWMQLVPLESVRYTGADIVPALVEANRAKYGRPGREFRTLDIVEEPIPAHDLIFCRDCIMHLPNADIQRALLNFSRSGAKFLLITSSPRIERNTDLAHAGGWRAINLALPPFHLPEPIEWLLDDPRDDLRYEKRMNLYRLPLPV